MKFLIRYLFLCFIGFILFISHVVGQVQVQEFSSEAFQSPAGTAKPLVWWHWISGNVTKEGILKDLIDLKDKGIGGVQQFDVGMYPGSGLVPYGSESWHEHIQYAIQVCDSLGLEFYMMNSPGYSGAGGPWVPVEKSMKLVVWGEQDIVGDRQVVTKLSSPYSKKGYYEDIAVIAVPKGQHNIEGSLLKVSSSVHMKDLEYAYDNDYGTSIAYPGRNNGKQPFIQFDFSKPVRLNLANIDIVCSSGQLELTGSIETSYDGNSYKKVKEFKYDGHRALDGNFSILFDPCQAKSVRIRLEGTSAGNTSIIAIREIKFRYMHQATNLDVKTGTAQFTFEGISDKGKSSEVISLDNVLDITRFYDERSNEINWNAPKGEWTVLRIGYTTNGKQVHPAPRDGLGYEIDKLDPEAVAFQFEHSLGKIIKDAGTLTGNTFKGILFDSFEGGFQNWTPSLPEMFKERKQYDVLSYLPVLAGRTVGSDEMSAAFLWDFRDVVNKLFGINYFGTMQKLAHRHNLVVYAEAQGGQLDPAICNVYTDIPMNEFWTDPGNVDRRRNNIRHTVSIANILGRQVVGAEAFTSRPEYGKWLNTPFSLKKNGDYAFTTGLNRFIFHTYTHQPFDIKPGMTMGRWGTHFSRHITWWEYGRAWVDYLSRSQYLLQKGRMVADICYLFPEDSRYRFPPKIEAPPFGYEYDIVFPEYLDSMGCVDNQLRLRSGANYKLMVLADYPYMTIASLKNINRLLGEGAIIVGSPPRYISDLEGARLAKSEFDVLVNEIWGDMDGKKRTERQIGRGKVYWGKSIKEILTDNSIAPDVSFVSSGHTDSLKFIHRETDGADIYFISNQEDKGRNYEASFRITGKMPELWDPETGKVWDAPRFTDQDGRISLPLELNPYGSVFVVFKKDVPEKWIVSAVDASTRTTDKISDFQGQLIVKDVQSIDMEFNNGTRQRVKIPNTKSSLDIASPWTLSFLDGLGAPDNVKMDKLMSWTDFTDEYVRYYSGRAVYTNSFAIKSFDQENEICLLNLGELYDIAAVKINNQDVGIVWRKPYVLSISEYIIKGKNTVEITVANRWINRLIGDEFIPSELTHDERGKLDNFPEWYLNPLAQRQDKRFTFSSWKHYDRNDSLPKSGLIGLVTLHFYRKIGQ